MTISVREMAELFIFISGRRAAAGFGTALREGRGGEFEGKPPVHCRSITQPGSENHRKKWEKHTDFLVEDMGMGQNPGTPGEHQNSWDKMDVNNPLKML